MKKICIGIIFVLVIFESISYAKYSYSIEETIIELSRDSNLPNCTVTYSTEEITKENVLITITSDKEIEQASGFELSENHKVLTKEVSENESDIIKIRDLSGNITEVEYDVNNIDKEVPQIIGCEDGGIYQSPLLLEFEDNMEIENIFIDKYDDVLNASLDEKNTTNSTLAVKIDSHPKGTRKYKYYIGENLYTTSTYESYIFAGLEKEKEYIIRIEAIDEFGNILDTANITEKTNNNITKQKNKEDTISDNSKKNSTEITEPR